MIIKKFNEKLDSNDNFTSAELKIIFESLCTIKNGTKEENKDLKDLINKVSVVWQKSILK